MKCPYCAEDIEDDVVVCKHCQRDLAPALSLQIFKNLEGDLHVLKSSIVLPTFVGFAILVGLVSGVANYFWWLTPAGSLAETATKVSFLVVGPLTALLLGRFLPGSSLLGYLLVGFLSGVGYIVSEALQVQVVNPGEIVWVLVGFSIATISAGVFGNWLGDRVLQKRYGRIPDRFRMAVRGAAGSHEGHWIDRFVKLASAAPPLVSALIMVINTIFSYWYLTK